MELDTLTKAAAAVVASLTALSLTFRFIVIPFFINPILTWYRDEKLGPELKPMADDIATTLHLVRYHLGPNGTTVPMRDRLLSLEVELRGVKEDVSDLAERG